MPALIWLYCSTTNCTVLFLAGLFRSAYDRLTQSLFSPLSFRPSPHNTGAHSIVEWGSSLKTLRKIAELLAFTLVSALATAVLGLLYLYFNHESPFIRYSLNAADVPEIAAEAVRLGGVGVLVGAILWIVYVIVRRDLRKF
jgi:hypothetical protein